ncbi:MAG: RluA family pseudouridine synthase [Firmicutes bacterium HGW-Firmicutes-9]|jgi:RluA family pseudouridine synthase|nr:MAG: RluA family pseudouridine synthase [Firmicutes bacterium HGW-Firmicutes-9]
MRTLTYTATPADEGRTVQNILRRELACSESHISRLKRREEGILLGGMRCYVTARVKAGDLLAVEIGDLPDGHIVPIAYPLDVIYEDDDLLILNKPAGISVHQSTRDPEEITLENAVCHHLGGLISPHPVSRLDRGTSGLIAFAKSGYVHERLRRQMHTSAYARVYLGIACGIVTPASGVVELPIGMAEGSTFQRAICDGGQRARTEYETLTANEQYTLLRLVPRTGRTHQLRLHMSAVGYPLAGDWLYGVEDRALIARPALHSYELSLTHPIAGKHIHLTAELPEDMRRLIDLPKTLEEIT